ncbi:MULTISPECIES: hypothetical protein [unclassified Curtobacterium]|uniref:hypothetical protein n=1 Tax=unclassified Curtobacterium TaxID=257496 RepID=UPI000F4C1349|nr:MULTISPECIES: hypothetical protein [unclassified Curtobacterium]
MSRPIAALAVVGVLSLLSAGCSAGGDDPSPSPTKSASRTPTSSATVAPTATSSASTSTSPSAVASEPSDDDTDLGDFPGTGSTGQADTDPGDFPATAIVTFASWDAGSKTLQTAGLVSGTTNAKGTCTFTAKNGGTTRTTTSAPSASASSVSCAQATFPAGQISTGNWSVTLKYTVGTQSTTSDPMTAEVP